jgi:hypothetical protein
LISNDFFVLHRSSQNGGSTAAGGGAGSLFEEAGLEPLDFRADDFVSALDKLLLGKLWYFTKYILDEVYLFQLC